MDLCGFFGYPILLLFQFLIAFGMSFGKVFGVPGDFKNQAKVWDGCQNHTFTLDFLFAGTDSVDVFATELFMFFVISGVFEGSILGAFGANSC